MKLHEDEVYDGERSRHACENENEISMIDGHDQDSNLLGNADPTAKRKKTGLAPRQE